MFRIWLRSKAKWSEVCNGLRSCGVRPMGFSFLIDYVGMDWDPIIFIKMSKQMAVL